ncbi:MAG: D-alanyl-D-alanine carboxypeptidase family protein [Acidimicrobiales bacterium]
MRRNHGYHGYGGARRSPWATSLKRLALAVVAVAVLLALGAGAQLLRSVPPAEASVVLPDRLVVDGSPAPMPWPAHADATVEVEGIGNLGGQRATLARPLASLTKLVTALVILKDHPLALGQSGPALTVTSAEAAEYRADLAQNQSVARVETGERLTELEALEAMLVPSANNVARILARWDSGNMAAFVAKMNAEASALHLAHTHLVGPAGLNPGSVGAAADMVRLAQDVMANPVLARIVGMVQVTLPEAGTVYNYDRALGHDGIIGIKTGSTTQAGGNFVFVARRAVDGRTLSIAGALLGAGGVQPLKMALADGERLASAAFQHVERVTVLPAGKRVIEIRTKWGSTVPATTARAATLSVVPGELARLHLVKLGPLRSGHISGVTAGERLAVVEVTAGNQSVAVPVVASGTVPPAPISYRLERL